MKPGTGGDSVQAAQRPQGLALTATKRTRSPVRCEAVLCLAAHADGGWLLTSGSPLGGGRVREAASTGRRREAPQPARSRPRRAGGGNTLTRAKRPTKPPCWWPHEHARQQLSSARPWRCGRRAAGARHNRGYTTRRACLDPPSKLRLRLGQGCITACYVESRSDLPQAPASAGGLNARLHW